MNHHSDEVFNYFILFYFFIFLSSKLNFNEIMQVTEEDLKVFFTPSRVKEVRILRERGTARPRVCLFYLGFWIILF